MAARRDINDKVTAIEALLVKKFGVRPRGLDRMLRKTGRRLPRGMRRRGATLVAAQKLGGNPRLARQLNGPEVQRAFDDLRMHLESIDVAERRKDRLLKLAGLIAFYILATFAAFVTWLWWVGYV